MLFKTGREINQPSTSLPGGENPGCRELGQAAGAGGKGTHTPDVPGAWIIWGSSHQGWMQTFGATLSGRRRGASSQLGTKLLPDSTEGKAPSKDKNFASAFEAHL